MYDFLYNNDNKSSRLVRPSYREMSCFLSTNQKFFRLFYSRLKYGRPQLALTSQGLSLLPWQHLQLQMCSSLVAKLQISEQVFLVIDESAPWLMILFVMRVAVMAVVLLNLVSKHKRVWWRKNSEKRMNLPFLNKDYECRLMSLPFSSLRFLQNFLLERLKSSATTARFSQMKAPLCVFEWYFVLWVCRKPSLKIDAVLFEELNQKKKKKRQCFVEQNVIQWVNQTDSWKGRKRRIPQSNSYIRKEDILSHWWGKWSLASKSGQT